MAVKSHLWELGSNLVLRFFPNKEEASDGFLNAVCMALYFIFSCSFEWVFVLKNRCQFMILNLWWFVVLTSCSPAVPVSVFSVLGLNLHHSPEWNQRWCLSAVTASHYACWTWPRSASQGSPQLSKPSHPLVKSGWNTHDLGDSLSLHFFSAQCIQDSPGQRQHLFLEISKVFAPPSPPAWLREFTDC